MARKGRGTKGRAGLPYGVRQHRSRFEAKVQQAGRQLYYLGTYDSAEEAAVVAQAVKAAYYGGGGGS
jgi:hypothetical protein